VEQLVRHHRADRLGQRWVREVREVVLGGHVAAAAAPVAALGRRVAVRRAEVAQVDVDPTVAAAGSVGQRPAKAQRKVVVDGLLGGGRDLGDEVRDTVVVGVGGEHRVGSRRRIVYEHIAAGSAIRRLPREHWTRRARRRREAAERDGADARRQPARARHRDGSCFHSTR
jgi:hypothetical protein